MSGPDTERLSTGDLPTLLDDAARVRLLRSSGVAVDRATCSYIRFKPGVGALVGLELDLGAEGKLAGYVRTHSRERAAELVRKWHPGRTVPTVAGDGVRLLTGGHSVLFLFPNDARVRGMRFVADVDKLKRSLLEIDGIGGDGWRIRGRKTTTEIVRYKPERRLIMRAHLRLKNDRTGERREQRAFLRFFADDRGARMAELRRALAREPVGEFLPAMLGSAHGGQLFVEEDVGGHELLDDVVRGAADPEAVAHVRF